MLCGYMRWFVIVLMTFTWGVEGGGERGEGGWLWTELYSTFQGLLNGYRKQEYPLLGVGDFHVCLLVISSWRRSWSKLDQTFRDCCLFVCAGMHVLFLNYIYIGVVLLLPRQFWDNCFLLLRGHLSTDQLYINWSPPFLYFGQKK